MKEFLLTYTSETKEGTVPDYRSINEVTFLKRGFRWEPRLGRYVGPLEMDTIIEMPYWMH